MSLDEQRSQAASTTRLVDRTDRGSKAVTGSQRKVGGKTRQDRATTQFSAALGGSAVHIVAPPKARSAVTHLLAVWLVSTSQAKQRLRWIQLWRLELLWEERGGLRRRRGEGERISCGSKSSQTMKAVWCGASTACGLLEVVGRESSGDAAGWTSVKRGNSSAPVACTAGIAGRAGRAGTAR